MIPTPELVRTTAVRAAVIPLVIPGRDMPKYMDPAIQEVVQVITAQGRSITGPLFSFHQRRPSDTFDFQLGFPVDAPIKPTGRVINGELPAVEVARSVYTGPYEGLSQAWGALQDWVKQNGHGSLGRFWESYLDDPEKVQDPRRYRTELNWIIGG